jgi:protein involved in polysaccharide export with SLBB domain
VERYQDHERKIILDLDMDDLKESGTILEDGDLIKVFSVAPKEVNAIFLKGNVAHPGKYQMKPGMTLSDLLSDTDDVLPDTYFGYAVIERLEPPEMSPRIIPFNPGNLLLNDDKDEDLALRAGDTIVVYDKWRFKSRPAIDIEGQVRNPGKFNLMDDMRVRDLILAAGGLTGDAYMELGEIYSTDGKTNKITVRTFNPGKALDEGLNDDLLLKDLDRVVIHSILEFEPDRTILVNGAVNQPGKYPFAANMTLKDAIFAAGNLLESAYMDEAEIIRKRVEDGRLVVSDKVSVDLRKVLSGDKDHNLPLRPYDAIFIKNIPEWSTYRFATIKGEVKFPGKYLIARGDRISSLLERTGNLTEDAYLKGGVFTRLSSRERQKKRIDAILEGLEKDVLRVGSGLEALTETETEATLLSLKTKSILIEKLKKPSGFPITWT